MTYVSYFSLKSDEFQSCKNQLCARLHECIQFLLKNANFDSRFKTLNEPSVGDTDSGSSITEQQKMPDLSEQTKLVQRKNNSMSAVVVPVSTSSSGDEGGLHEDMEDKPLDSAGEEVSHPAPICTVLQL